MIAKCIRTLRARSEISRVSQGSLREISRLSSRSQGPLGDLSGLSQRSLGNLLRISGICQRSLGSFREPLRLSQRSLRYYEKRTTGPTEQVTVVYLRVHSPQPTTSAWVKQCRQQSPQIHTYTPDPPLTWN